MQPICPVNSDPTIELPDRNICTLNLLNFLCGRNKRRKTCHINHHFITLSTYESNSSQQQFNDIYSNFDHNFTNIFVNISVVINCNLDGSLNGWIFMVMQMRESDRLSVFFVGHSIKVI